MNEGPSRVACKLDRVLVGEKWLDKFPNSFGVVLPNGISDHSPLVVRCEDNEYYRKCPFKFFNFWASDTRFLPLVKECWDSIVVGNPMFRLVRKLKMVKRKLRELNCKEFWCISERVKQAKDKLDFVQNRLLRSPLDERLIIEEKDLCREYRRISWMEESLLKQKSRINWLKEGDQNSRYFFKCLKSRQNRNSISAILDDNGNMVYEKSLIKDKLVGHFKDILSNVNGDVDMDQMPQWFNYKISDVAAQDMVREVSEDEIKSTIFAMNDNKAPGPDGFGAKFYKTAWERLLVTMWLTRLNISLTMVRSFVRSIVLFLP